MLRNPIFIVAPFFFAHTSRSTTWAQTRFIASYSVTKSVLLEGHVPVGFIPRSRDEGVNSGREHPLEVKSDVLPDFG
jgi:hypothetical protein